MAQRRKIGTLEKVLGKSPLKAMLGRSPLKAIQKALYGKKTRAPRKRK